MKKLTYKREREKETDSFRERQFYASLVLATCIMSVSLHVPFVLSLVQPYRKGWWKVRGQNLIYFFICKLSSDKQEKQKNFHKITNTVILCIILYVNAICVSVFLFIFFISGRVYYFWFFFLAFQTCRMWFTSNPNDKISIICPLKYLLP